jgi:DNA ligase 1
MLSNFARVAAQVAATTKKLEKERIVADWIRTLGDASLERAVVFLAGSPFPRKDQRVTGVGWAAVIEAVSQAVGIEPAEVGAIATAEGDLGDAVARFFPDETPHDATIVELGETFDRLAHSRGAGTKANVLAELFSRVTAAEARYVTKILLGELRIGLQEGLVESAIARAFEQPLADVRRAHMFTGDLGATALLARSGTVNEAVMTLFRPIGFMLAQAEESAAGIFDQLGEGAIADDKYDGIRAQVHASGGRVRIWSRTLDDITERFPEVSAAAAAMPSPVVLDGEIVAYADRILPFATLQKRIGRRKVSEKLLAEAPVVFFAYDLLFADGEVMFERPLRERLATLRNLTRPDERIRLPDSLQVRSPADIETAFDAARARANEGLVVKDPGSPYTPGRRGKAWLKYKKALATLDCVVTAARYGNGKRRNVLSDYTFAIAADGELLNIGKAYSGLTDVEIDELTELFKRITRERHGPVHLVQPRVVLEIAFDRIQESSRHKSGFALRFPRIARIRHDRKPDEISTLDEVRRIYEGQLERERGLE